MSNQSKSIKIRENYIPKAKKSTTQASQICPRCTQHILANEMSNHVRICLLDPKWRLQKQKLISNKQNSNINTQTASDNLKAFANSRPDIFVGDEKQLVKKNVVTSVIWDGTEASKSAAFMEAQTRLSKEDVEMLEAEGVDVSAFRKKQRLG